MPTLLESVEVKLEWEDLNGWTQHLLPPAHPRSPGVHLSGVLRYVAINAGILKGVDPTTGKWVGDQTSDGGEIPDEEMPLRMGMGMGWEMWAAGMYPDLIWQPGEFELDGVFGTPDGVTPEPGLFAVSSKVTIPMLVEEFKLTWSSSRKPITSHWMWMHQGMGYCKMLDTRWIRFHVGYVCGGYTRPFNPQYFRYLIEFSQKEIDMGWQVVLRNKDNDGVRHEQ